MGAIDKFRYAVVRRVSKIPETSVEYLHFKFSDPVSAPLSFQFPLSIQSTNPNEYLFPKVSVLSEDLLNNQEGFHIETSLAPQQTRSYIDLILCNTPLISENLFEKIEKPIIRGKNYSLRVDALPRSRRQRPLFPPERPDDDPIPRGRTSGKVGSDIWDLLLPCLQPPVDLNFVGALELPPNCEPYGYQWEGIQFLAERESALLGDDMGTGKTVQSALACRLLFQKSTIQSALIVSPLSVVEQWETELQKWAPALKTIIVKGQASYRKNLWEAPTHIRLTNYEILRQDMEYLVETGRAQFDLVILDEAQRIKNSASRTSKAVRCLQCRYKWGLSGTPIENSIDDLVSIFSFIQPKLFSKVGDLSPAKAKDLIKPFFIRRRLVDVLSDLPEKEVISVWLALGDDQQKAYDEMEGNHVLKLHKSGETLTALNKIVLIEKLKEICNLDPNMGASVKFDWLKDNLPNICESGNKSLVFTQYKQERFGGREWLAKQLQLEGFEALSYDGTTKQKERIRKQFKDDPEKHIFVAYPKSVEGLSDLVVANYAIMFDHWWNPAVVKQAVARIFRHGQEKKKVVVYDLWVRNTIEEMIYDTLEKKRELYGEVIDNLSEEKTKGTLVDDIWKGLLQKHGFQPPEETVKSDSPVSTYEKLISDISPDEFEKLVADLFSAMGYKVKLTPKSNDGGVDVIARKNEEKLAIQCKLQKRPIGVDVIRELLGVISNERSYSRGLVVTNSVESSVARKLIEDNGQLSIIGNRQLKQLLQQYGLLNEAE